MAALTSTAAGPSAYCTRIRHFTYRLQWRPERHYVAGTQVELRSHCLRAFISWRYAAFSMGSGDITFRWKLQPTTSDYMSNPERVLMRARLPYGARKGEPIDFELTVIPPVWAGISNVISVWTIDVANNFAPDEASPVATEEADSACELSVVSGPIERLSVYSRPAPGPEGCVRTLLVPEDRFGNPGRFKHPLVCDLAWNGEHQEVEVQDTATVELPAPHGTQRACLAIPMAGLAEAENVANGRRMCDSLIVTGNPVWPEGPGGMRAGFGEFHWHTGFSGDGQRPIEEALQSARDYLNMDFAAPGDHNPQGDAWNETVAALEAANAPGHFATFFGLENGTDLGHENYYFTDPGHPLVCGGSAGIVGGRPDTLTEELLEVHREHDFIAIPHHTNAVAETRKLEDDSPYWHPYPWGEPQGYTRLVEIMQIRGNQERDVCDDAWRGWHQNNHASVQHALALGHQVGFVGGTDNHCGWPGRAFAESEGFQHPVKSVILTGVWTPRIERGCIFESLKARRTWAVWDTRALVWFTVNGPLAGDELHIAPGTPLIAHIMLSAEDALQTVEIVSAGRAVWQHSFAEMDIDIQVPLGEAVLSTHFYLRALQRDGGIIYASPVFVVVEAGQ